MSTNQFVGTWRLRSFELRGDDGALSFPWGAHPQGYLTYTEDGRMSVMFMREDRAHFLVEDVQGSTQAEKVAAMESFFAYCGTYEPQGKEMVHHIEVALFPNWCGAEQRRVYHLQGNQLTLSAPPRLYGGVLGSAVLVWERI